MGRNYPLVLYKSQGELPGTLDNILKVADKFIVDNEAKGWREYVRPIDLDVHIMFALRNSLNRALEIAEYEPRNELFEDMTNSEKQGFISALHNCMQTLDKNEAYLLHVRRENQKKEKSQLTGNSR